MDTIPSDYAHLIRPCRVVLDHTEVKRHLNPTVTTSQTQHEMKREQQRSPSKVKLPVIPARRPPSQRRANLVLKRQLGACFTRLQREFHQSSVSFTVRYRQAFKTKQKCDNGHRVLQDASNQTNFASLVSAGLDICGVNCINLQSLANNELQKTSEITLTELEACVLNQNQFLDAIGLVPCDSIRTQSECDSDSSVPEETVIDAQDVTEEPPEVAVEEVKECPDEVQEEASPEVAEEEESSSSEQFSESEADEPCPSSAEESEDTYFKTIWDSTPVRKLGESYKCNREKRFLLVYSLYRDLPRAVPCLYCGIILENCDYLYYHILTKHANGCRNAKRRTIICPHCSDSFETEVFYQVHLYETHEPHKMPLIEKLKAQNKNKQDKKSQRLNTNKPKTQPFVGVAIAEVEKLINSIKRKSSMHATLTEAHQTPKFFFSTQSPQKSKLPELAPAPSKLTCPAVKAPRQAPVHSSNVASTSSLRQYGSSLNATHNPTTTYIPPEQVFIPEHIEDLATMARYSEPNNNQANNSTLQRIGPEISQSMQTRQTVDNSDPEISRPCQMQTQEVVDGSLNPALQRIGPDISQPCTIRSQLIADLQKKLILLRSNHRKQIPILKHSDKIYIPVKFQEATPQTDMDACETSTRQLEISDWTMLHNEEKLSPDSEGLSENTDASTQSDPKSETYGADNWCCTPTDESSATVSKCVMLNNKEEPLSSLLSDDITYREVVQCYSCNTLLRPLVLQQALINNFVVFLCAQCLKNTEGRGSKVLIRTHFPGKFVCNYCKIPFYVLNNLIHHNSDHLKTAAVHKAPVCYDCGFKFKSLKNLSDHTRLMHDHPLNEIAIQSYPCVMCQVRCLTKEEVKNHVIFDHDKCNVCWRMFGKVPDARARKDHVVSCKKFRDSQCELVLVRPQDQIDRTMPIKPRKQKKFKCNACYALYETYKTLQEHLATLHRMFQYNCIQCGLCFYRQGSKQLYIFASAVCEQCLKQSSYKLRTSSGTTSRSLLLLRTGSQAVACEQPSESSNILKQGSPEGLKIVSVTSLREDHLFGDESGNLPAQESTSSSQVRIKEEPMDFDFCEMTTEASCSIKTEQPGSSFMMDD